MLVKVWLMHDAILERLGADKNGNAGKFIAMS
jgi:hypothetical protein